MKKRTAGVAVLVGAFWLLVFFFTQRDDDLDSDIEGLLRAVNSVTESEAYLFNLGIFVNPDQDPKVLGMQLLEEYRQHALDENYAVVEYPEDKKLLLPQGKLFCKMHNAECLGDLFRMDIDIGALNREHTVLIARLKKFHQYREYTTLQAPSFEEHFPAYQYLMAAERINTLKAIALYHQGEAGAALNVILGQIDNVRTSLALQDNLIGKLVFLMRLSELLDVASVILETQDLTVEVMPNLSPTEKDFSLAIAREFGMFYATLKKLDKHPEFFELGGNISGVLVRLVYKPNMTINAIVPEYRRAIALARLTPKGFAKAITTTNKKTITTSFIRNYVGNILLKEAPTFDNYIARFMDVEAKITLFNQRHYFKREWLDIKNPYDSNKAPEVLTDRACFSGPLEDTRSLRCLRVAI